MQTNQNEAARSILFYLWVNVYDELPGLVKIFGGVSHSTSHTKTLPQGAGSHLHKLLLLKCAQHTKTHTGLSQT